MAIKFNNEKRIFTIDTRNSTYQFQADSFGYLLHLYYGRKTFGLTDWALSFNERGFSVNPYEAGSDRKYSLDYLPNEFPVQGSGDFRSPLLIVRDNNGVFGCDLRYEGYEIQNSKYSLEGLPAVYANPDEESETLIIFLKNKRMNLSMKLLYGVLPEKDIITRSAVLQNDGTEPFTVMKFQSACLDFTHGKFDLITFHGRHTLERQFDRQEIHHGSYSIGSRRGMSSHQYNPFLIIADHDTNETSGKCWGMQFVYSGGFLAETELDQYNQTRVQMGLSTEKFAYTVKPGEKLTAPEVIMTFSNEGLEKLSHNLHDCIRKNICRGKFRDSYRPIVLNSWEALYFNFHGEEILNLARQAKLLGFDMLVLDDGWFMNRSNDDRALGDWIADEKKLGGTLTKLVQNINSIGLDFGLWIEPEMISESSNLYQLHPDWAMKIPNTKPVLGRNQLVLDLSRRDVIEYIYNAVSEILEKNNIKYLKWDYNRSISEVYSCETENQGNVLYDYILGLYEILERLNSKYPDVLIEGCAGGGGRFDSGMLYYTPQIWCSDNTDALDRIYIHYGTSFGYPASVIGSHVSICPNHQTGRITPLRTRFIAAKSGAFGYELNPSLLSETEKNEIIAQISQYKKERDIISNGLYYRLSNPESDNFAAWEYISRDRKNFVVNVVVPFNNGNMPLIYITPRGLTPKAFYRSISDGEIFASDALMDSGFSLGMLTKDFECFTFNFERI